MNRATSSMYALLMEQWVTPTDKLNLHCFLKSNKTAYNSDLYMEDCFLPYWGHNTNTSACKWSMSLHIYMFIIFPPPPGGILCYSLSRGGIMSLFIDEAILLHALHICSDLEHIRIKSVVTSRWQRKRTICWLFPLCRKRSSRSQLFSLENVETWLDRRYQKHS